MNWLSTLLGKVRRPGYDSIANGRARRRYQASEDAFLDTIPMEMDSDWLDSAENFLAGVEIIESGGRLPAKVRQQVRFD